ncbi:MAG: glycosyltransferase family 1 protein [Verrucomicrobiota bacterium]
MKITFVTDTYPPQPNGVANSLQRLVEGLRKRNHEVDVIRPAALGSDEEGMEVPSVALPKYREIRVGIPMRFPLQVRWSRNPPDVIYSATPWPLGTSAIKAAHALGIPVASGFHTNFQRYMEHYEFSVLEKTTVKYLRRAHNRSDCTFVPTHDMIDELSKDGFRNLRVLPKGVDSKLFSPKRRDSALRGEWGAGENSLVALYVGRIAAEKNLPLVIRTFIELEERIPDFRGVLVGDGPKAEELKKEHSEFIYPGLKFGEDLARYYASADLFVFPSTTETFGNVTLEALASGLIVVAYDYVAAHQHISDGINGYLAPLHDEEAFLSAAFAAVSGTAPAQTALRKEARKSARRVRWSKVVQGFERDLIELIEEHHPESPALAEHQSKNNQSASVPP